MASFLLFFIASREVKFCRYAKIISYTSVTPCCFQGVLWTSFWKLSAPSWWTCSFDRGCGGPLRFPHRLWEEVEYPLATNNFRKQSEGNCYLFLLLTEIIRDGGGVQLSKVILNNNAEQRPWLLQEGTKPVEVDFEAHIKCISEQHITFVVTFRQFALVIARTDWPGAMGIFFLRDVLSKSWPCTIWSVRSP